MEVFKPNDLHLYDYGLYQMYDAFTKNSGTRIVKMGKAVMKPGVRVPTEDMSSHDENEFSYVIKGSLVAGCENVTINISGGDFSFIPKGMKHWCKNEGNEDCELIWVLVGEK